MITEKTNIEINGIKVPLMVYRERRRGWRFSVVKDGVVNVRLPIMFTPDQEKHAFGELQNWLERTFKKKESFKERFQKKNYQSGDILTVGKRQYGIEIVTEERKGHSAKLDKGTIFFKLAAADSDEGRQKVMRQMMSRLVAQDFLPEIARKTHEINHLHFRKNIKSINFKYNHTNWGSCSRTGNINFSTRLLFAPDDVIDYVIVHELSHLVEMNHSDRFWRVVENVMPDYQAKEKWLSANSALCDF
jgi:predicted metal-dependent hydrolase